MRRPTYQQLMRSLALWAMVFAPLGTSLAAEEPETPSVVEPALPAHLEGADVVYHTLTGREAQVTFTSGAPLENIVGKSNAVAGYLVPGPDGAPAELAGAHWVLPVRSLATGIPLRDSHLAGREWLDAESFPEIVFKLDHVEDIASVKSGDGFSTWTVTLVGEMTLHGATRELRVEDARLSFLDESEKTRAIAPGDLCFLKCDYTVRLSDFGIEHKDVPGKVSDEIALSQMLRMSTRR